MSIVQDIQAKQYETARTRLKRLYRELFGIDDDDWQFLKGLAAVRTPGGASTVLTRGSSPETLWTDLYKGHAPIRIRISDETA